jgi:virulence-associated protein VapD
MNKNIEFDFCIIPNPFASGGRNMIFITKAGESFLNREVSSNKEYEDIKEVLEKFGYTETDYLQFESSNNATDSTIMEMKSLLKELGLSYSRELEVSIVSDLNNLKVETDKVSQNNLEFIYGEGDFNLETEDSPIKDKTKNKLIESKRELFNFKYKEPELQEKVSLYFYLFLEFGFNQAGNPIIQFGGDFKDSGDYDDRNYIKIVKSDFLRVKDDKSPNSIILQSCKSQEDFLKEIGILYSGFFRYQKKLEKGDSMILKETKFPYKLAEVRKHLKPDQSIVVETNRMGYDRLIKLSKKIKTESVYEGNTFIATGDIEYEAEELSKFLSNKMALLSDNEEFEEASKIKRDVEFIREKVVFIKSLNKPEITTEEYFKLFSIS